MQPEGQLQAHIAPRLSVWATVHTRKLRRHRLTESVTAFVTETTPLSTYSVIDLRSDLRLAALRDHMGRKYVVRLSAELPDIGADLAGGVLTRGTRVLLLAHTGQVFDVRVDASECTEQYVFERLHVAAHHAVCEAPAVPLGREVRPAATSRDTWEGVVRAAR